MKSLILKDLYNLGNHMKTSFIVYVIMAFALIPASGAESYIYMCAILSCMMIITTFAFDDTAGWNSYALTLPITRKRLVQSKYVMLLILALTGALLGVIVGVIGGSVTGSPELNREGILLLSVNGIIAVVMALTFGGMAIPLVFRFGAEKARLLLIVSFVVPVGAVLGISELLTRMGIEVTDQMMERLVYCMPVSVLLWDYLMYRISCRIFEKKEL